MSSKPVQPGEARKLSAVAHALAMPKPVGLKSKLRRNTPARKKVVRIVEVAAKPLMILAADLLPHPKLERIGLLPQLIERETNLGNAQGKSRGAHKAIAEELERELAASVTSIETLGIQEKLKVVRRSKGGWWIADGRHRWEVAKRVIKNVYADASKKLVARQLEDEGLPCEEIQESEVDAVILSSVNRRHYSKGALAYIAVLMHPEVANEAKRGGDQAKRTECALLTAEALADQSGVSPRLMDDAISLFRIFAKRKDVRKKFEEAIWIGAGLAKLKAGVEGFLSTGIEPDEESETDEQAKARIAMERVDTALQKWVGVTTSFKQWESLPKDGREAIAQAGVDTVLALPEEVRKAISEALDAREF